MSEPSTAIATTTIVARPNDANVGSPVRNIPAIAAITVSPEISTERPDVAAAASSAARSLRPGRTLLPFALQVEHRVVDADGEADEQDERGRLVGDREQVTGKCEQAERREDGGQPEQQRDARGDERAERDQRGSSA